VCVEIKNIYKKKVDKTKNEKYLKSCKNVNYHLTKSTKYCYFFNKI